MENSTADYRAKSPGTRAGWMNLSIAGIKLAPKLLKLVLAITSVVAYSYLFTWQFALIIVSTIFIHELGHYAMMRHYGLKTKGIYLIPFFGGAAVSEEAFPTRRIEAVTALMGPLVGFDLSIIAIGIYQLTSDPMWAAVASWVALVNLFNLLPVTPLDGGRIIKSSIVSLNSRLSTWLFLAMMALAVYVMVTQQLYIFILLLIIGTIEFFADRRRTQIIPKMNTRESWLTVGAWLLLVSALWFVMLIMSHEPGAAAAMHVLQG